MLRKFLCSRLFSYTIVSRFAFLCYIFVFYGSPLQFPTIVCKLSKSPIPRAAPHYTIVTILFSLQESPLGKYTEQILRKDGEILLYK